MLAWILRCSNGRMASLENFRLVSHPVQRSCPVLRTTTRFHANQAGRTVREILKELCPLDRFVHDLTGFWIHVVHLVG